MPTWKQIPDTHYSVSDSGEVRNEKTGRIKRLQHESDNRRYKYVDLYDGAGKRKRKFVHRLVCEAFLDKPDNDCEVNHKDGNPENNNVDNLEWCSHKENCQHAWRTGLIKPYRGPSPLKGRKNPNAGPPRVKVMCVETGIVYDSVAIAERETGATHIYDILCGTQTKSKGLHFVKV